MESVIQKWSTIIKDLHLDDHPYKVSWGRAILDVLKQQQYELDEHGIVTIKQEDIICFAVEYVWNQVVYFELDQGYFEEGQKLIEDMKSALDIHQPVWFEDVKSSFQDSTQFHKETIKKWIKVYNKHAAVKFTKASGKYHNIYEFNRSKRILHMTEKDVHDLLEYYDLLHPLINHQWGAILSKYNISPNISTKVCQSCFDVEKRNNLRKYRNLLLENYHFHGATDFYTGEHLSYDDIGIDYVIPYRYCYMDNLWNLVIVHKERIQTNEEYIPTLDDIQKLENRNQKLLESLRSQQSEFYRELEFALSHNLAKKYYLDFVKKL